MKKLKNLKVLIAFVVAVASIVFVFVTVVEKRSTLTDFLFVAFFMAIIILVFFFFERTYAENNLLIEEKLSSEINGILKNGDIGVVYYDEDYVITYLSRIFINRHRDYTGEKLLLWLPQLQDIVLGQADRTTVVIDENKYEVTKADNSNLLFFKDISREYDLQHRLQDLSYVLGFVSFDNYDESIMSEEDINFFNFNIKPLIIEYFKNHQIVYHTTRSNQLHLILNNRNFENILSDHFSIMRVVRKEARKGDLDVTLSMSFALGSSDLVELDKEARELLELAQTRGGDQVVVRHSGKEAVFYGGSSEAKEKQSKVKVRVTANTLRHLIDESSNVIICCHNYADADCVGASLCISNIAHNLNKQAYIILKSGGIDSMIADVITRYKNDLDQRHSFISLDDAFNYYNDNSLVVMVDHHSLSQSNAADLLVMAKKIVIIDHHRRKADLEVNALLMYVEASSSSATELCLEFLPYLSRNPNITMQEANIMFLGLLIDTNHFRVRTGSRTFDVAKALRQYGADPAICDELSQEPYDNVRLRTMIISAAERLRPEVLFAAVDTGDYPRSIISQACDQMVQAKEIEAAFVICTSAGETVVSARSNGRVNVQTIMERMKGGGHMTAAGLQSKDATVAELAEQLKELIKEYFVEKERVEDEGNSVK